ncbi:MAG: hypothetical protein AABY22_13090 [Nanoarchaeota archaeon]
MKANIELTRLFVDSETIREYSAWCKIKDVYVNSCFYNFNWSILANKIGVSRNTAKKYIEFFVKNGWAYYRDGNVILVSHDKLKDLYGVKPESDNTIQINSTDTIQQTVYKLRNGILVSKQLQFDYVQARTNDVQYPKGLKDYKRGLNFFKKSDKNYLPEHASSHYQVSTKALSKILNISKASVCNFIKRLVKEKKAIVFKTKPIKEKLTVPSRFAQYDLLPNQFIWKGFKYTTQCNQYKFI